MFVVPPDPLIESSFFLRPWIFSPTTVLFVFGLRSLRRQHEANLHFGCFVHSPQRYYCTRSIFLVRCPLHAGDPLLPLELSALSYRSRVILFVRSSAEKHIANTLRTKLPYETLQARLLQQDGGLRIRAKVLRCGCLRIQLRCQKRMRPRLGGTVVRQGEVPVERLLQVKLEAKVVSIFVLSSSPSQFGFCGMSCPPLCEEAHTRCARSINGVSSSDSSKSVTLTGH
jgi:hypothetical protein